MPRGIKKVKNMELRQLKTSILCLGFDGLGI